MFSAHAIGFLRVLAFGLGVSAFFLTGAARAEDKAQPAFSPPSGLVIPDAAPQGDICPALSNPDVYTDEDSEDYALLIAGKDNWVFRSRLDLKFRFMLTDKTEDSFRRLNDAFKYKGADLVIGMIPTRGIADYEELLPPYSDNYDHELAMKNYLAMLDNFRSTGVLVADMKDVDKVKSFFLKRDNHWTTAGSRFMAERVAQTIKGMPVYKGLKKESFSTSLKQDHVDTSNRFGDFIEKICGRPVRHEQLNNYFVTQKTMGGVDSNALFGEQAKPEIALIGTSNSTNPEPSYANFEGFLEQNLGVDIANYAVSGGSLQGSIGNYLVNGDFARDKPKVVIWEMAAHYGFNQQDFLREVVPAVYGQCSDKDAVAHATVGVAANDAPIVLDNLGARGIKTHRYYAVFKLSDTSQRTVKVRFTHADGRTDTVKLERSERSFPQNPGLYFAELNDVMEAPLDKVTLGLKGATGTVDARICKTPVADTVVAGKKADKKKDETADDDEDDVNPVTAFFSRLMNKRHYTIDGSANAASIKAMPKPSIPDMSGYTREAALAKIPEIKPGIVKVEQMEGAPPLRKWAFDKRLVEMQTIQKRIQPLAIHIHSGVYDIKSLMAAFPNEDYIVEKDGGYVLRIPIAVYPGASLVIRGLDKPLLLSQDRGAFIAGAGNVYVVDSKLIGWNEAAHKPAELDETRRNFRPFLTMWDGTELYIVSSTFQYMGYALSKSYGLTVSTNDVVQEEFASQYGDLLPPTGWIMDSNFDHMYFGFYSYEAVGVVILRNTYKDNVIYGIDPHDRSRNLLIAYNKISGSKKKHGIIISRDVDNSWIVYNETRNNKGSGIMLDRNCQHTVVAYNKSFYNHGDGITLYESPNNALYANVIENNDGSGIRIRNSWNISAAEGSVAMNNGYAFEIYEDSLKHTTRDFEMDPVTTRAGAVFQNIGIESNAGILKTAGFENVRFENMNLEKQFLGQAPFGGDVAGMTSQLKNYVKNKTGYLEIQSRAEIKDEKQGDGGTN